MLELKEISSGYGKKQVLSNASTKIEEGEAVLLTGGNGSGKSTLLKCIYNQLPLWSGEILFNGKSINKLSSSDLIKQSIVYIPQKDNVFLNLTVQENLELSGSIYSKREVKDKIEDVFNLFPQLEEFRKRTPFNISGGEKQLLCCGMALMHKPKLILFDEPLAGLSGRNAQNIVEILNEINNNGTSLLIVEHQKEKLKFINKNIELYLGTIKK